MRILAPLAASFVLLTSPAHAIVGGPPPSTEGIGNSVVTIVGSRGTFCSGGLIAPRLVLTVAHCVQNTSSSNMTRSGSRNCRT